MRGPDIAPVCLKMMDPITGIELLNFSSFPAYEAFHFVQIMVLNSDRMWGGNVTVP